MLIRDVMTETVVVADPAVSVREIAKLMRDHSVGSVVLVEHERPVGFITDRDLAMSVVADGRDSFDPVSEHASTPVITADPEAAPTAAPSRHHPRTWGSDGGSNDPL